VAAACAELARVDGVSELTAALARVSDALGAAGLIIWAWDAQHQRLRPVVAHGYGAKILAHVPPLRVDEKNATATAFRTGEASTVAGSDTASGALAVPLVAPGGSVGVLAIEFRDGREQHDTVRALATMVAAVVTLLVGDQQISPAASTLRDRIA
jgi:GAF domain-containing protein